jgi:hypothetical protein
MALEGSGDPAAAFLKHGRTQGNDEPDGGKEEEGA